MKTFITLLLAVLAAALIAHPSLGQDQPSPATAAAPPTTTAVASSTQSTPEDMQKMMAQMMEMSKLNENHKLLSDLAGNWTYTIKFWMSGDPTSKPEESKGKAVRKSMWDGRYFALDVTGKMEMPQADGKKGMKEMTFRGMGLEGYDNAKQKFVSSWVDNMGTGIMMAEGTYDPATKTLTYTGEFQETPEVKKQIREVVKLVDKDHHTLEWYENRDGKDVKTMEINYTRAKGK